MQIPWWVKISAKLVLSRLPFGYHVWQRLGLFRHGRMDASEYAIRIFDEHVRRANLDDALSGRTILELGPGDSVASAVIAAARGARAILVDSGPFASADVSPYLELQKALAQRGRHPPELTGCPNTDALLRCCKAQYLTQGLTSLKAIETASVDLIFSQAVLEHVRVHEFAETMRQCRRILKPGGLCSHQIDLRDHLGGALNNLRFSSRVWESELFARSGFYTNRIPFSRMTAEFEQAGFQVQVNGVRRWAQLPTPRKRLAREFRDAPDRELCVSGFDVILR